MKRRRKPPSRTGAPAVPAERAPTYEDLLSIVHLIQSASQFSEFRLRSGDIEVEIRRANGVAVPASHPDPAAHADPAGRVVRQARAEPQNLPPGTELVRAPMVGTFYRAPAPGAPPFVEPGSRVSPDSIVCIIEVMKLLNSITAGVAGVVTHALVDNAEPVEYGQPLIAIKPDA